MRLIITIFAIVFLTSLVSAAYYVANPTNCPSSDGTNFPGQNCAPQDICGASGSIAQCYDTSTLVAPGSSSTTGSGGTSYTCQDVASCSGYIVDCYATADAASPYCDNSGSFILARNSTCFNKHTQTTATGSTFGASTCSASCVTNYFICDGSSADADGCEINAGSSCGSGTGTIVNNQCFSASAGNCTRSSDFLDCDNDDSDSNTVTCNGANGCEINPGTTTNNSQSTYVTCSTFTCKSGYVDVNGPGDGTDADGCEITVGGACTVGSLSGTYDSSGVCVVPKKAFVTGNFTEYSTNATEDFLWGRDHGVGDLINFTSAGNDTFIVTGGGNVLPSGNLTVTGSRGGYGFFNYLGSLVSRILAIYVQDININGTITGGTVNISTSTGNIVTSGNVTASRYCNATNCYTVQDFLTDTTGSGSSGGWVNDSIQTNISLNVNVQGGANVTSNWFRGLFNWTVGDSYLSFNGALLAMTSTATQWFYNQTTPAINDINTRFWNRTQSYNNTQIDTMIINNASYTTTFNATYANLLNQNCPAGQVVNGTLANGTFICTTPPAGSADGTGGWINDSINTNTSRNVNIQNGANLTIDGGNINLNNNATIKRGGVNTSIWITETGILVTKFG